MEEGKIIVIEVTAGIICPTTEITAGPETETVIDMTIDMVTGTKIMVDLGKEIGGIEAVPGRVPNPEVVPKTDMKIEGKVEMI